MTASPVQRAIPHYIPAEILKDLGRPSSETFWCMDPEPV